MKRRVNKRGFLVRVYEKGEGARHRYHDALDSTRFHAPRLAARRHPLRWYCDGHLANRPSWGLLNCAKLAEHMLAKSYSLGVPPLKDAASYYAATRRALVSMLTHHRISRPLDHRGARHARKLYRDLCKAGDDLLSVYETLRPAAVRARNAERVQAKKDVLWYNTTF